MIVILNTLNTKIILLQLAYLALSHILNTIKNIKIKNAKKKIGSPLTCKREKHSPLDPTSYSPDNVIVAAMFYVFGYEGVQAEYLLTPYSIKLK